MLRQVIRWFIHTPSSVEERLDARQVRQTRQIARQPCSPLKPQSTAQIQPKREVRYVRPETISGKCYVIDGDTIKIGQMRLRLAGIDAPELNHPWGKKAKWELVAMCEASKFMARIEPDISYDRLVATCFLPDGRDLSAEMVRKGLALDWPEYSKGEHSHLEPDGARKKHWKAAARQRGHMHIVHK